MTLFLKEVAEFVGKEFLITLSSFVFFILLFAFFLM